MDSPRSRSTTTGLFSKSWDIPLVDFLLSASAVVVVVAALAKVSVVVAFLFFVACVAIGVMQLGISWSAKRNPVLGSLDLTNVDRRLAAIVLRAKPIPGSSWVTLRKSELEAILSAPSVDPTSSQTVHSILEDSRDIPLSDEVRIDRDRLAHHLSAAAQ